MKRMSKNSWKSFSLSLILVSTEVSALTLNQYLRQVDNNDRGVQSVRKEAEGMQAAKEQYSLLTTPNLIASFGRLDDRRPKSSLQAQGDQILSQNFSFGLQQMTPFGLKYSVTQNFDQAKILSGGQTLTGNFNDWPEYNDVYPKIELSLSLWRNFLGRETKGDRDNIRFSQEAGIHQAEINRIRKENEVEEVFFELANQMELLKISKESLSRSQKILDWSQNRVSKNLAEKSDLYQAQAAEKARRLDLVGTEQKLADSARRFNRMRGVISDEVPDKLVVPEPALSQLKLSKAAAKQRKDVKAIEALSIAKEANYLSQKEKLKPELDFIMNYTTVGRAVDRAEATQRVFNGREQIYMGVNFKMPLDLSLSGQLRDGYALLAESQRLKSEDQLQILKSEWAQFVDLASHSTEQYLLLKELEVIQKNKADSERSRLNQGRSTTFQVLNFETDYLKTRGDRLAAEYKIRQLIMNLKLFE